MLIYWCMVVYIVVVSTCQSCCLAVVVCIYACMYVCVCLFVSLVSFEQQCYYLAIPLFSLYILYISIYDYCCTIYYSIVWTGLHMNSNCSPNTHSAARAVLTTHSPSRPYTALRRSRLPLVSLCYKALRQLVRVMVQYCIIIALVIQYDLKCAMSWRHCLGLALIRRKALWHQASAMHQKYSVVLEWRSNCKTIFIILFIL